MGSKDGGESMKGQPYHGFRTDLRQWLIDEWIERRIEERRKAGEEKDQNEPVQHI